MEFSDDVLNECEIIICAHDHNLCAVMEVRQQAAMAEGFWIRRRFFIYELLLSGGYMFV